MAIKSISYFLTNPNVGNLEPARLVPLAHHGARAALISVVPAFLAAQTPGTGVVAGRILARADTGAPMPTPGATIFILGTALRGTADDDGSFVLGQVPAGSHTMRVRLIGYRTAERVLRVRAGDTVRVNVMLETDAQLLAAVRTDARQADAELFLARPSVSILAMGAAAMAGVPRVGEPDVVRIVQLLPGVVARNDFNTG